MSDTIQTIKSATHPHLQAEIHYDQHATPPELACTITYNTRSRYTLGTVTADSERDEAIARSIRSGEYIGIPVFAYVHSGVALRAAETNPFHCQWDSGRSGWAYMAKADVRSHYDVKRITKAVREQALTLMRGAVDEFSQYLNGEVYGFVIRDTETDEALDSCWGYYGLQYVEEEARSALKQMESITQGETA